MNANELINKINNSKLTISNQQQQNAALISIAFLIDTVFTNITEVVSYQQLSHEKLEALATEYYNILSQLRNVFFNVSKIATDNDSAFGTMNRLIDGCKG